MAPPLRSRPLVPILAAAMSSMAVAGAAPRPQAAVAPVVETEHAFARAAAAEGIGPAFRRFAAADAILFTPAPAPAAPALASDPPGRLLWWPLYAGIAASGDLGFTTGPYAAEGARPRHGYFLTIWRKQPDGSWRWVLDHGFVTAEAAREGPDSPAAAAPRGLPVHAGRGGPGDVVAAEAALARALATDARRAYAAMLAGDGRMMREGSQPAIGRAAFTPFLASIPARMETARLGGGTSKAGDLAFAYGSAVWQTAGKRKNGYYIHVWQRRQRGWVLLVDEVTPAPPPAPRAAQ